MENKEKVVDIFKSSKSPLRPGDIAAKSGIDSKEISTIIKALKEEGRVYSPKRCYYALKE
ncbi:MAG: transcriptional regulator [Candidatus Lokiarchaeota archaeon]|nr:transcriptional regulator [Candidatus Lokiarchaeota archaeon]